MLIPNSDKYCAFLVGYTLLMLMCATAVQAQSLRFEVRYEYHDGSFLDVRASAQDTSVFVEGWNNVDTGLSYGSVQGTAYNARLDAAYDVSLHSENLQLLNRNSPLFGDYGDEVSFSILDSTSFANPTRMVWDEDDLSSFIVVGYPVGVLSTPKTFNGGSPLTVTYVPLPGAAWMFVLGLLGLFGTTKRIFQTS